MTNSTQVALILTATDRASAIINSFTNNAGKKLTGIASFGKKIADIGPKMMVVGDAVTGFFKDTIKDAQNADKQYRLLEKSLLNVGDRLDKNGKGIVAQQLAATADDLELKIGQEAESIMQVQSKLSLYKSVISKQSRDNGLFNKAVQLAFDMQARGMGDATSNAKALGMALENPEANMKKLTKAGIIFTDAEKKKVKALQDTGQKAQAQQLIINKVMGKVGGAAEASVDPLVQMDMGIDNIKKKIGGTLLPIVQEFAKSMNSGLVKQVMSFVEKNPGLIKSIAGIGLALLVVGKTISFVSTIAASGGLGIALMAIALVASIVIANWDKIGPFFSKLWSSVKNIFSVAWKGIKAIFFDYTPVGLVYNHWGKVSKFFSSLWAGVKNGVKAGWELIKNIFFNYTPEGLIISHWSGITAFFTKLWGSVKGVFKGWIDWVFGLGGKMVEAGGNIITSLWKGISDKAMVLVNGVKGIAQKVRDFFPFSPAKAGPLRDIHKIKLVETIAQSINASPLIKSMEQVTGKVFNYKPATPVLAFAARPMQPVPTQNYQRGSAMPNITYAPTFHLSGSATEADAKQIAGITKRDFEKLMRDYEAKNRRTSIK